MAHSRIVAVFAVLGIAGWSYALLSAMPARAAADTSKEIATAAIHAGLAAKAANLDATQMHLHHVINCLVGPKGEDFDAKVANPCKAEGDGAIPDATDPAEKTMLNQALDKANDGLKQTDLAAAHKTATEIQALLKSKAM